jgi:hypothetical protein
LGFLMLRKPILRALNTFQPDRPGAILTAHASILPER